jgi:hypothetical protein
MVVASVALIVALGGTAFAGPLAHLAKLVNGDSLIKKGTLSGNRLRNHTLTATQINLSELGVVPSAAAATNARFATSAATATNAGHANVADSATTATSAQNASTVDGASVIRIFFKKPASTSAQPVLTNVFGLTISAACDGAGNPVVSANGPASGDAELHFYVIDAVPNVEVGNYHNFGVSTTANLLGPALVGSGGLTYTTVDGHVVTMTYGWDQAPIFNGFMGCTFDGTAVAS